MIRAIQKMPRRYKWLLITLTPCLILAGGAGWLVATNSGLLWLAGVVERQNGGNLSTNGISGSLFDNFGMQQLVLRGDGWRVTLQGMQLEWQPAALLRGELEVLHLRARQVEILSLTGDTPSVLPGSLGLPLLVSVKQLKIDSFSVITGSEELLAGHPEGAEPDFSAREVEARLTGDTRLLKLQALSAKLDYGDFAGSGELALNKPYVVKAQATLDTKMTLSGKPERAHLDAVASGDLEHIVVKLDGGGAGIRAHGAVQIAPLDNVTVSRVEIAFSGMDAGRLIDGAPTAILAGSVDLHGMPAGGLDGFLQIRNAHAAPLDQNGLPLLGVTAQVRWSSSVWQLQQLDARLPNDGHIAGTVFWEEQRGKLSGQLKVHQLDPSVLDSRLPATQLHGDITFESVGGEQHAVVTLGDGTLDLYGELKRHRDQVNLTSMRLKRGAAVLSGHGQLSLDRRRTFRLFSQLRNLNLSDFAATPPTDLNAVLELSGTLLPKAQGKLQIDLSGSQFAQIPLSGSGRLEFFGTQHASGTAEVRLGDNHFNLSVAHGTAADRLQLKLDAPNLAQLGYGLGGQFAGHADLTGSLAEPRLQFSAQGKYLKLPGGQRIAALDATGDLASAAMQLNLGVKDYRGTGELNIPEGSVELQGSRELHTIRATASISQGEDALGELTLKANGSLSDPEQGWQALLWRGELDELKAQGVLPFHLLTAAPLTLGKELFYLGTVDMAIGGGKIQLFDTQWTPQRWHSAGHFSGISVRAVNTLQSNAVPDTFEPIRLGGSWEATADDHWHGQLQAHRESGDWLVDDNTGLRLGLRDLRFSLRAEQDKLQAQLDAGGEYLGDVAIMASMPLSRTDTGWTILPDAPLTGNLRLYLDDLSWIGLLLDSNLRSGGRLNFDAKLIGTLRSPRLQGVVQGEALSLGLLDQGIRLEQGELQARFESDAVHIDHFAFRAPYLPPPRDKLLADYTLPAEAGQLSASGRIDLEGGSGDMEITAVRLPLAQRADRWIIASGKGHARYANKSLMLDGNIRADAGLINQPVSDRPRLSRDVQIIGQELASRADPPISVDATLNLGEHFYIRASGLEARLTGQLKVHDEPGVPLHVTGIIAARDALFEAYGQRLQVERGMVNFQGSLDDPGLNILALRKGLDVEAGVEVTGTVRRPTVRLVSTPNVPDAEKLTWIVLGRVPDSSGVDSSVLLAAAGNILGGQSVGKLGQELGMDELSLSQQAGKDSQQIQKVTVGKKLSARARISYEQSLSEVGGVTKFTYTLTPRISIVTRTGTEDAIDLFYTFRFY